MTTTNVFLAGNVVLPLVSILVSPEMNGFIKIVLLGLVVCRDGVQQSTISGVLSLLLGSILWDIRPRVVEYGMKFVFEFEGEGQTYTTTSLQI